MTMTHGNRKIFWFFSLLDCWKMTFPYLKGKLTLLAKTSKFTDFFFVSAACTAILSSNWKNNNTIVTVSKIQTMRKLSNPSTTSLPGSFLSYLDSTCLNDSIVIKIKEPFTPFFFKKPFCFVTMMIVCKFGDLNFIM